MQYKSLSSDESYAMIKRLFGCVVGMFLLAFSCKGQTPFVEEEKIVKLELHLSAFGVEADDYPSIDATIDLVKDTGSCVRSFYNPAYKGSTYSLPKETITKIHRLLRIIDIQKLKTAYKVSISDQPSSKTIIYTTIRKYEIDDYGLKAESPLQELYRLVYIF